MLAKLFGRSKPEARASDYTQRVIAAGYSAAEGKAAEAAATAAAEHCIGLISRCLAVATPQPQLPALTPGIMERITRQVLSCGEAIWAIRVGRQGISLDEASNHFVFSGRARRVLYQCDFATAPDDIATEVLPADAVVHCRYSSAPREPWKGLGPLQLAAMSSRLAAAVEKSVTEDAESSSGWVLPAPLNSDLDPDDNDNPITKLIKDLRSLKGKTALVPTTATGWGSGRAEAPLADWRPHRIGFSPEQGQIDLRAQAVQAMFNVYGVPLGLAGDGDATSMREAFRVFGATVLAPLARILAAEIGEKLDVPDLEFTFGELLSADIVSRSRAFGSIAAALSGSMDQGGAAAYAADRVGFPRPDQSEDTVT